jgi:uncharacterized repeat protein (TIGR01451 family)
MNMKTNKKLNILMLSMLSLALVFGVTHSAHATYIMGPGIPEAQVYPGYDGPIIMAPSTYSAPVANPVVYNQPPVLMNTFTYQTQPTTNNSTSSTNTHVLATTIRVPQVQKVTTSASTTGITANSETTNVCSGDTVNYTINYANTTGAPITNALLVILMPSGIDYASATATASYSQPDRTVTIIIGSLDKGASGTIYLQGKANRLANGAATIATRVDFTYTKANGVNETTTSYIMHSGTSCTNALGANALGSGFLPTSFAGWVILTVLVCAIVFLARKYFSDKREEHIHAEHLEHQAH